MSSEELIAKVAKRIEEINEMGYEDDWCDNEKEAKKIISLVREQQNEALVTMVKLFKACIETDIYPIKDSPCYEKINELIEGEK